MHVRVEAGGVFPNKDKSEEGWAIIVARERIVFTGGGAFTTVKRHAVNYALTPCR